MSKAYLVAAQVLSESGSCYLKLDSLMPADTFQRHKLPGRTFDSLCCPLALEKQVVNIIIESVDSISRDSPDICNT